MIMKFLGFVLLVCVGSTLCDDEDMQIIDVPYDECQPGFEYFSCHTAPECMPTCQHPKTFKDCSAPCVKGCFCKDSFLEDEYTGMCVPAKKCPECPKGRVYKECTSPCPPTCRNPDPQICNAECISGCFCADGMVLDEDSWQCVMFEECPPECPPELVFMECGNPCAETCQEPDRDNKKCRDDCVPGCYCMEGLLWDDHSNQCVRDCTECQKGFTYDPCGSTCEATCQTPDPDPESCTGECISNCFCRDGTIFNEISQQCVIPSECPLNCPSGFEYNPCGTSCQQTCANLEPDLDDCNDEECVRGCFCKVGTYLDENFMTCVPLEVCTETCESGFTFDHCGSHCEASCQYPITGWCVDTSCVPGCYCRDGTMLDLMTHQCVKECPVKCPETLFYDICGNHCEPTCQHFGHNTDHCSTHCIMGCFCRRGYLFDEYTNTCVRKCPKFCDPEKGFKYDPCRKGTACEPTCQDPFEPLVDAFCNFAICIPGCYCQEGMIFDQVTGTCMEECPEYEPNCPAGWVYNKCGSGCPKTCQFPHPEGCVDECSPGCYCPEGTTLDEDIGKCVKHCPEY